MKITQASGTTIVGANIKIGEGSMSLASAEELRIMAQEAKKREPLTVCPRCKRLVWSGAAFYQHTAHHGYELSYEHEYAGRAFQRTIKDVDFIGGP